MNSPAPAAPRIPEGFISIGPNGFGIEEFRHELTGMVFVLIPSGTFQMGTAEGNGEESESPVHTVEINAFLLARHEVTQGVWQKIMGSNPSYFKTGNNHPVEQVSWTDCDGFCRETGLRLPSEAEWEYACRAGAGPDYIWEKDHGNDYAQYGQSWPKGHFETGSKKPNNFGLYDMIGNVWEWCNDYYDPAYYSRSPESNPQGPEEGDKRALRGGSWWYLEYYLRSSYRTGYVPGCFNDDTGLRCASSLINEE